MITDYSAPIQTVYAACVDKLLQNIARHFGKAALGLEGSFDWDTFLLSEMGALTRENAQIIAETVGDASGMTRIALEQAMADALKRARPDLLAGVRNGILDAPDSMQMTQSMQNILRYYSAQASVQTNLVNTVMLSDSQNAMRRVVSTARESQQYLRDVAQGALNTATGEVVTGTSSAQAAIRGAIRQMAKAGIVGYRDKAGRLWSPEAYVSMDVRTTAGNVARAAVLQQNRDYGIDLVIVPVNRTARPGCAPFQGKIISMSGQRGYTTDRYGNRVPYISISDTTYGEPDGLFGINCHHTPPDPFVPGVSRQHDKPESDVAENYQAQQNQRYLEREVKNAKREAACYNAAGDTEAFAETAKAVKQKQAALKDYCERAGLPYQSNRTQVYGYDRSTSGKATQAVKANPVVSAPKPTKQAAVPKTTTEVTRPQAVTERQTLIQRAKEIYIRENSSKLGAIEAARRFDLLVDGNTTPQLRDYVKKRSGKR